MRTHFYLLYINGSFHGALPASPSFWVPAAAGTEGGDAQNAHATHRYQHRQRRARSMQSVGPVGSRHPMLRPNAIWLPATAASCMLCSRSHLLAARDSPHCPSSSALLLKDELLDFEHLRSLLSSSVWPADASVKESARASTAVSMAAAAQAVRGDRACLSHHLLQLCWLHALPASRAAQIATRSDSKGRQTVASFGSAWPK